VESTPSDAHASSCFRPVCACMQRAQSNVVVRIIICGCVHVARVTVTATTGGDVHVATIAASSVGRFAVGWLCVGINSPTRWSVPAQFSKSAHHQ
jgi:hypothetical protein